MPKDLAADMVEKLLATDSPTVSNAVEHCKVRPRREGFMGPRIQCRFPDLGPAVGFATTCTIVEYDEDHPPDPTARLRWLESIAKSSRPTICVVKDETRRKGWYSHWGEMVGTQVQVLGASAIITDGAVRDIEALHDMGIKIWSESVVVSHGHITVGEANVPIEVGGLVVKPGDLLHADCNGIVSIPLETLDKLPGLIDEQFAREKQKKARTIERGSDLSELWDRIKP